MISIMISPMCTIVVLRERGTSDISINRLDGAIGQNGDGWSHLLGG